MNKKSKGQTYYCISNDALRILIPLGAFNLLKIICYCGYNVYLNKIDSECISYIENTPEIEPKSSDIDYDRIKGLKYGKDVIRFVKFITEKYPKSTITNFYNNINTLNIVKENKSFQDGEYDEEGNIIYLSARYAIFHELLHMASTVKNGDSIRCGFSFCVQDGIDSKPFNLGYALNEGYTQLLSKRYFARYQSESESNRVLKGYPLITSIAEKLEEIIGKDKMEKLYFKADLRGLINELRKYAKEEEIISFISSLDKVQIFNIFTNKKIVANIYSFLERAYKEKLTQQLSGDLITQEEFDEKYDKYINSLGSKVKILCRTYDTFPQKTNILFLRRNKERKVS